MLKRFLALVMLLSGSIACGLLYSMSIGTSFEDYLFRQVVACRLLNVSVFLFLSFLLGAVLYRERVGQVRPPLMRLVRLMGALALILLSASLGIGLYMPHVAWMP